MSNHSHLTAIVRKNLSLPVRFLKQKHLLLGRVLDYGCGRGYDCDVLCYEGYDPFYRPVVPEGKFDTIYCVYVLNVLSEPEDRVGVLIKISDLLVEDGKGYIAVRRGVKEGWTSRGTYQCNPKLNLPSLKLTSTYEIYELRADIYPL